VLFRVHHFDQYREILRESEHSYAELMGVGAFKFVATTCAPKDVTKPHVERMTS